MIIDVNHLRGFTPYPTGNAGESLKSMEESFLTYGGVDFHLFEGRSDVGHVFFFGICKMYLQKKKTSPLKEAIVKLSLGHFPC